jgi:uncharacterized protein YciI
MPLWVRTVLVTGPEQEAAAARREHVEHLRRLAAQGKLRAAGEFAKGEGFLEIFEADDLHAAEAIARESPLVEMGLGTWMLRRWDELNLE